MKIFLTIITMAAANCFLATGSSVLHRNKSGLNGVHLTFGVYHASSLLYSVCPYFIVKHRHTMQCQIL